MINKDLLIGSMDRCGTVLLEYSFRYIRKMKGIKRSDLSIRRKYKVDRHAVPHIQKGDFCITTRRDLREIIASAKRYYKTPYHPKFGSIAKYAKMQLFKRYYAWEPYSNFEFLYETFILDKTKYLRSMFDVLKIEPTKEDMEKLIKYTSTPLRSERHITNKKQKLITYKDTLTDDELQEIYDFFDKEDVDKNKFLYIDNLV